MLDSYTPVLIGLTEFEDIYPISLTPYKEVSGIEIYVVSHLMLTIRNSNNNINE